MPAISKSWVTIADTAVDPDSPLDAALMTGLRDDLVHLREWVGAGYVAGAVQDHNHDGVNSAPIDIGTNNLKNGSFESDLSGWTETAYTGGTIAINTANDMDGQKCLAITSTVLANGGGDVVSGGFSAVTGGQVYPFTLSVKASAANVSSRAEVIWYDDAQAQISTSQIFDRTNTETALTRIKASIAAPATARFMKVRLTGGLPAVGAAVGTIYFDGVGIGPAAHSLRTSLQVFTASGTFTGRGWFRVTVIAGGGEGGDALVPGLAGSSSSFGADISATGGGAGIEQNSGGAAGANGTATGSDAVFDSVSSAAGYGAGGSGISGGGDGGDGGIGRGWVHVTADVTVTVGAGGNGGSTGGVGQPGVVMVEGF